MIKELINDLVCDKVKLSQALSRAKVVATKLNNEKFITWLKKELEGYEMNDPMLPKYRYVFSPITLTAKYPFGLVLTFPFILPNETQESLHELIEYQCIKEPISLVEEQLRYLKNPQATIQVSPKQMMMLSKFYDNQIRNQGGVLSDASRTIEKSQIQNIIELTKQRLIDTLIEFDRGTSDPMGEYNMSIENSEKLQDLITNIINGINIPKNIAAGKSGNVISVSLETIEKLKKMGVDDTQIEEFKVIVADEKSDRTIIKTNIMKWLGPVSATIGKKELFENIPVITELVLGLL